MTINSQNINNAQSSNWIAYIPGYEDLVFKVTKFSIPTVTAGVTSISDRTEYVMQETGSHIIFENLTFEFLVDENFRNYIKLYKWMRSNMRSNVAQTTSVFIHLLDNNKEFQEMEIEFLDAFPIEMDRIDFDTDGATTDVKCSVTFEYTCFDFVEQTERD